VNVGRVPVYLLDANRPENEQHFRDLTARVYGGDSTTRIMQEMLLGIGGVRLLRKLGVQPSVFHMNEGHAAFLTLELIREKMAAGQKFSRRARRDQGAMHFHHAHAGGGRPRPLQPRN
jgi:starch phosphorylase